MTSVSACFPWHGGWGVCGVLPTHLPRRILKKGLRVACPPTCNSEERDGVGHAHRFALYFWKGDEEKGTRKLEDRCYFQNKGRILGRANALCSHGPGWLRSHAWGSSLTGLY